MRRDTPYVPIADYGLIGDMHSCALVSRDGSVDWACFPRFDSPSVFGRILDAQHGGYFLFAPQGVRSVSRRYLDRTNVLETTFETDSGTAVLTDFMPVGPGSSIVEPRKIDALGQIARVLECTRGTVEVVLECRPRFEYGSIVPHAVKLGDHTGFAHGGASGIDLYASLPLEQEDGGFRGGGQLREGERACAVATFDTTFQHQAAPSTDEAVLETLRDTIDFWELWCGQITYDGPYREQVLRSVLVLKALTYAPTGGLLAAATTSLPEEIGGIRNWDYRYTWIRDAAFAVYALSTAGLEREATEFKQWLEWSTAGRAHDLQVMYGIAGERLLPELELQRLEGYRGSAPVRIGNAASDDFQLDIYGELMDSAHLYRKLGGAIAEDYWDFLRRVVEVVIERWREPDEGIWEVRGGRRHFVFSKALCWVALDRGIKAAEALDLPADLDRWHVVAEEIRADVLEQGYNGKVGAFTQAYGSDDLDASVLMLPLFGFISVTDRRMRSTIAAVEQSLAAGGGHLYRYRSDDGLAGGEGTFNICTFWLVDNLIFAGEVDRARDLFERICRESSNDLGLMSEQLDPATGTLLGNFPQAFSHLGLINAAIQFERAKGGEVNRPVPPGHQASA